MGPYNVHFWGIAGGVNAGFEKTFFPEHNISHPFDCLPSSRFKDERLLLKLLFSNGLICRLDIINDCISVTKYKPNSDRQKRPAFTAGTFYFDTKHQLTTNLKEFTVLDQAIIDCIETQKIFSVGGLTYPNVEDIIPDYKGSENLSLKSKIKKAFVVGADDKTIINVLEKSRSSSNQNAVIYFIKKEVDLTVELQKVLSEEVLKSYSIFNATSFNKDIDPPEKSDFTINMLDFFDLNRSKNGNAQRVKRICFSALIVSLLFLFIYWKFSVNRVDYNINSELPISLKEIQFLNETNTNSVSLFDTLSFKISSDYPFSEDDILIESTSNKSLIFENIDVNQIDVDSGHYLLRTVLANDTTHLSSSLVEIIMTHSNSTDTCSTNFNLDI